MGVGDCFGEVKDAIMSGKMKTYARIMAVIMVLLMLGVGIHPFLPSLQHIHTSPVPVENREGHSFALQPAGLQSRCLSTIA